MPKSDSWPGGVSKELVSGMDSAGSCDSMISVNSTFTDDSLEHLSAEEKACLMFLEETIESLEVDDDSGLSNDELDRPSHNKISHQPPLPHNKLDAHEDPNKVIGRDHRLPQKYLVPTPLLVASGNAKIINRPAELSPKDKPAVFVDAPDGFRPSPVHHQTALAALKRAGSSKVPTAKPNTEPSSKDTDLPPSFIPEPPVRSPVSAASKLLSPKKSLEKKKNEKVSPEMLLGWIPPPSDFMDEPAEKRDTLNLSVVDGPPDWTPELPKVQRHSSGGSPRTEIKPRGIEKSRGSLSKSDIENLRQKASMKKAPLTPVMIAQNSAADYPRTPSPSSEHLPISPNNNVSPKTPPPVAPKLKLPSNIILKSHKESGAAAPLLSPIDRSPKDQQKIHMEALRKLGLLKNDEIDSGPVVSSSPTFKYKDPVSPHSPTVNPTLPNLDSPTNRTRSPMPGDIHIQTEGSSRESFLKKSPARPYEIKSASLERSGITPPTLESSTNRTRSPMPGDIHPQIDRESFLKKSPARPYEIKSASLERSGVNSIVVEPKTITNNVELSPGQLRKNRARPSSSGSAKDVVIGHLVDAAPAHAPGDAQKTPRFNGISVMITPNGRNGENHREALKKLGLLKDGGGH